MNQPANFTERSILNPSSTVKTHEIMNVHNLYFYHCINDIFKVLKYRTPISLYSLFETSDRLGKETLILTPKPSDSYIYRAGTIWNTVRQNLVTYLVPASVTLSQNQCYMIVHAHMSHDHPRDYLKQLL